MRSAVAFFYFDLGAYLTLEGFKKSRQAGAVGDRRQQPVAGRADLLRRLRRGRGHLVPRRGDPDAGRRRDLRVLDRAAARVVRVLGRRHAGLPVGALPAARLRPEQFGDRLKPINEGVDKDGAFYLFALRLVAPLFPFFVVNLLMGLTTLRTWPFYWVSQLGMLAGTAVYVNAGARSLHSSTRSKGILSPAIVGSFVLLGVFPILAKKVLDWLKAPRSTPKWAHLRPKSFERNIIVIGAGPLTW